MLYWVGIAPNVLLPVFEGIVLYKDALKYDNTPNNTVFNVISICVGLL